MSLATEFLIKNKKCVIFLKRVKCSLQMAKQLPIATVIRMCVWYTFMLFYMQVCSVFSSLILNLVVRSRLVGWCGVMVSHTGHNMFRSKYIPRSKFVKNVHLSNFYEKGKFSL